jgi:D-glycero-D-manno-heptose 1,7-bisphosphate phosphatase
MGELRNILLDRDGTIIRERHYLCRPEEVELIPGAGRALQRLNGAGYRLFLLSNQSGIGRGYFTESDLEKVQAKLEQLLASYGVAFQGRLHCPHAPQDDCNCRKPRTGMWTSLREEFRLRADESLVVGDKMADVHFGINAGLAATVLVLTGHGLREARETGIPVPSGSWGKLGKHRSAYWPHVVARDLDAVRAWLLNSSQ